MLIPEPRVIDPKIRRIVCAAIRHPSGAVICSPRHNDLRFYKIVALIPDEKEREIWCHHSEQGFVDQWGCFLDRKEALLVAKAADQIRSIVGNPNSDKLYSENLY